jgi:hypothetical protein
MAVLEQFGGIVPRLPWHMLPKTSATIAHDVKIHNGKLEPWRERKAVGTAVQDAVCVYYHGCCSYTFDKCVYLTRYVTDYDRLYLTGRNDYPEVGELGDNCSLTTYRLGVPAPTKAPTVKGTYAEGRDVDSRSYVYTFVNVFGEEGAPSPVSEHVSVRDGTDVVLSGFDIPDTTYGVMFINVYRTATVWRSGNDKEHVEATEYLFVGSTPVNSSYFTDNVKTKYLGHAIETEEVREPPQDMRQITYLTGTGVLAGCCGNTIHFSKAYQPYNWPAEYDLTLPYNIVNIKSLGSVLFVSTDGYPFIIDGSQNCQPQQCRQVTEVFTPLADISCGHVNSSIVTPFGMIYSSRDGLVLVAQNGTYQLITTAWFSTDDWVKIRPDTVRMGYWRGYVFVTTDTLSFMLQIDGNTYNDVKAANLVTLSDKPVAYTLTPHGELVMLEDNILWQWNAGVKYRKYTWTSRMLGFGGEGTPTVAKVKTDGIDLSIISEQGETAFSRFVPNDTPVRLKRLVRGREWRVNLSGKGTVEYVNLGLRFNTFEGNIQNGNSM